VFRVPGVYGGVIEFCMDKHGCTVVTVCRVVRMSKILSGNQGAKSVAIYKKRKALELLHNVYNQERTYVAIAMITAAQIVQGAEAVF
jgi:hypothetical protein